MDVRDGRPVLVQRRTDGEDVARLLQRFVGPGVPEVLESSPGVVVTTWTPPLPAPHGAADLAGIAAAVARAHEAGVVHGPFLAEHLRCGPMVSGWGDSPEGWTAADDVASFAGVLTAAGHHALAARAAAEDPAARPGMGSIAAALAPAATPLIPKHQSPARSPRPALVVGVAVPVLALTAFVTTRDRPANEPAAATTTSTSPATTSSTAPPFDGVLEHDGRRYALGEPGDDVRLGDWDCDGTSTPALHRPATGQVWRFDAWPDSGTPMAPLVVATRAEQVRVERNGGCDQLVVVEG